MKYCFFIVMLFLSLSAGAQKTTAAGATAAPIPDAPVLTAEQIRELQTDINGYMREVTTITADISNTMVKPAKLSNSKAVARAGNRLKSIKTSLQGLDMRWQAFYSLEQKDIASNPNLMQLMTNYQQAYLAASDSITSQQARLDAVSNFNGIADFIKGNILVYEDLLTQAQEYSLTEQTAEQLSTVKAQEQVLMQQISAKFAEAQKAAGTVPSLNSNMKAVQANYVTIQDLSKKIQGCEYKTLFERTKDYLISFAAVALIIMFFSMMVTKIAAMKKSYDIAKKFGDQMKGQRKEYPEI